MTIRNWHQLGSLGGLGGSLGFEGLLAANIGKKVIGYNVTAFDSAKHVNSWRSAWRTLTKKAGLPGFRFHDLRRCAITRLAENGTSDSTIMALAGHVSRRMLERDSHVRMEAKRTAMEAPAVSTKNGGL